jgi:hypothetical protein
LSQQERDGNFSMGSNLKRETLETKRKAYFKQMHEIKPFNKLVI